MELSLEQKALGERCCWKREQCVQRPWGGNPFERIAQMVIQPVEIPEIIEVAELDDTARGAGGFGSTGTK